MLRKLSFIVLLSSGNALAAEAVCSSTDGKQLTCSGEQGLFTDIDNTLNSYHSVTIDTTTNDRGYGLDFRQTVHHLTPDNINITTTGKYSDGIIGRIATTTIDGNLNIKTYGEYSSGILLQEFEYANVTIAGDMDIYTRHGMGSPLNLLWAIIKTIY